MYPQIRNWLFLASGAIYLGASYLVTTSPSPSVMMILISQTPLIIALAVGLWKSPYRKTSLTLFVAALVALILNMDRFYGHIAWLYFIQHAGAMSLLALVFGNTLRGSDAEAMCSRIAILIMPVTLDPPYLRYTWKVTLAWTIYFAACTTLSVLLFFFSPVQVWSVFANIITPVSIGVMFVGEYLIRRRVLPDGPKISIASIIQAYKRMS